jgi:hypothetical protein
VNRLSSTLLSVGLVTGGSNSVLTSDEEAVYIKTQAAILDIPEEYVSIVSATAITNGIVIVIRCEIPFEEGSYSSPDDMITALTTAYVAAVNNGDFVAQLVSIAISDGVASLTQVDVTGVETANIKLRQANEIATFILFLVVFTVILKSQVIEYWWQLITGFFVLVFLIKKKYLSKRNSASSSCR